MDENLRSGAPVEVFPDFVDEQSDICACYPARDLLTKGVSSLIDCVAMRLKFGPAV